MKSNASLIYNFFLVVGDFLALVLAFVGAYVLRVKLGLTFGAAAVAHPVPASTYLGIFLLLVPFWLLIFGLLGLYSSSIYEKRFAEAGRLFMGSFVGFLFVLGYAFFVNDTVFPAKLVPVYGLMLGFLFLLLFRNIARLVRSLLFAYNIGITNLLLVGDTKITQELIESLWNSRESGYRIVGVVGDSKNLPPGVDVPLFESFEQAVKKIGGDNIHAIVQAELYADSAKNNEILTFSQENHIAYRFVPGNSGLFVGNIQVELFRSAVPVVAVHQTALIGWGRILKRLFDFGFGLVLLILSLPFIVIIYLIMAIFDHGDPVFRQARLSRFGTKIYIYKFRTQLHAYNRMTPEAGFAKMGRPELAKKFRDNGDFLDNDPRISRLGRFLRKTSLDELPQLLNVVKGDLSLVGPRPLEPFELEQFGKKSMVLSVKPGLTGLAVVSGRKSISFDERRRLDMFYAQNWSFWLDLVILLKTIRVVLSGSGAK